jgi:Methyladenine glycosylase
VGLSDCDAASSDPFQAAYHDREYGFPVADDAALFERLVLEIDEPLAVRPQAQVPRCARATCVL